MNNFLKKMMPKSMVRIPSRSLSFVKVVGIIDDCSSILFPVAVVGLMYQSLKGLKIEQQKEQTQEDNKPNFSLKKNE